MEKIVIGTDAAASCVLEASTPGRILRGRRRDFASAGADRVLTGAPFTRPFAPDVAHRRRCLRTS